MNHDLAPSVPFLTRALHGAVLAGRTALASTTMLAGSTLLLATSCSISWYAYDPAFHHGDGGFPPTFMEAPVPREGGLPIAPVALRSQGGTIDYRPVGSRGLSRLTFYDKNAELSPGAYVLSYSASRAELIFGEGSRVVMHNRCTALVEDATQSGSLLYLSALERLTADLAPTARVRLPGGALIGAAPEAALDPSAEEAETPSSPGKPVLPDPPAESDQLPPQLLELLKGGVPQASSGGGAAMDLGALFGGAAAAGAVAPSSEPKRLQFVATDFRAGRYVRVKNRGKTALLIAHVSGDIILGPLECVDLPVLRGVEGDQLAPRAALLASELADGLRVRAENGARLRLDGDNVEVEAVSDRGRAWSGGAVFDLQGGERATVRPLHGSAIPR